jgi:hypothetical protein
VAEENTQLCSHVCRHQADVYHAYQVLKRGGLDDDHIVVMHTNDLVGNFMNPHPGQIFNQPGGPDVYDGVPLVRLPTANFLLSGYFCASHIWIYSLPLPLSVGFEASKLSCRITQESMSPLRTSWMLCWARYVSCENFPASSGSDTLAIAVLCVAVLWTQCRLLCT